MMDFEPSTERLIATLAGDLAPVQPRQMGWRIGLGLLGGSAIAAAVLLVMMGVRPDLSQAVHGFAFWMKWAYTISLAACAVAAMAYLARPTGTSLRPLVPIAAPVLLLVGIAIGELRMLPASDWRSAWLGHSWTLCPWIVLGLSLPIFAGLVWAFRQFAPTRLRLAGATAGLAAGAFGATVYALGCDESSAAFVLGWYSLGIALPAMIGGLLGPRLLRW